MRDFQLGYPAAMAWIDPKEPKPAKPAKLPARISDPVEDAWQTVKDSLRNRDISTYPDRAILHLFRTGQHPSDFDKFMELAHEADLRRKPTAQDAWKLATSRICPQPASKHATEDFSWYKETLESYLAKARANSYR